MKVGEILNEFDVTNDALLSMSRTVPHMAASGLDVSPESISHYLNIPINLVNKNLPKIVRKFGNDLKSKDASLSPIAHAIIAAVRFMKAHRTTANKRTPKFLEEITGYSYEELQQAAEAYNTEIAQYVNNFKPSWVSSIEYKSFKDFSSDEQRKMIENEINTLSQGQLGNVSAINVAKGLIYKYNLQDNRDSLRRVIDKMLSTDVHLGLLDKYRAKGKIYRQSDDKSDAIRIY